MQEVQPWLLVQHVAMDGGHVDAACPQCLDHGIHFVPDQNEITGNGGFPPAGRLEVDRGRYAHRACRSNFACRLP